MGETHHKRAENYCFWRHFCLKDAKIVTKTVDIGTDLNSYQFLIKKSIDV